MGREGRIAAREIGGEGHDEFGGKDRYLELHKLMNDDDVDRRRRWRDISQLPLWNWDGRNGDECCRCCVALCSCYGSIYGFRWLRRRRLRVGENAAAADFVVCGLIVIVEEIRFRLVADFWREKRMTWRTRTDERYFLDLSRTIHHDYTWQ